MSIIIEEIVVNPLIQIEETIEEITIPISEMQMPGPQGIQGIQGLKGEQGIQGAPGSGVKITPWIAGTYASGDQVNHLGKDWVSNAATVAGDVPGTSAKWVDRMPSKANVSDTLIPIEGNNIFAAVFVDANNHILYGVKFDGSFFIGKYESNSIPNLALTDHSITESKLDPEFINSLKGQLPLETGFVYVVVDSEDRIIFGIKKDGTFIASKFEIPSLSVMPSSLNLFLSKRIGTNDVICWGDSLTQAGHGVGLNLRYPTILQGLLGTDFNVINCGVGGEDVPTISARQGGTNAIITTGFTIPADTTTTVEISSNASIRLKSELYDMSIKPLLQGDGNSVNPVFIQDVECTLSYNAIGGVYSIKRNIAGVAKVIPNNSAITFRGAKYNKPLIQVLWMGANGGFHDVNDELLDYYKRLINYQKSPNFLVIGISTGSSATRAAIESLFRKEFGNKFLNIREYMSNYGLADAGISPTAQDTIDIADGRVPTSLRIDSIHFTDAGYTLISNQVYKRFKQLGYIN